MLLDIHVHSSLSPCSRLDPHEILGSARLKGLDGICITDHHTMEARKAVREGVQADGLCVIIGQEYSTLEGDFLLFGPYEALPRGLDAIRLLHYVRDTGGVAVAAHPFRDGRSTAQRVFESGLCPHAERENGRNTLRENRIARDWLPYCGLRPLGGSDAHSPEELGDVATRFENPVRSRLELIHLLKGQCQTSIARNLQPGAAFCEGCAQWKRTANGAG